MLSTLLLGGGLPTWAAPNSALAALRLAAAPANVPVSGRVTQANGDALPGVTVLVKGTTTGTSTGPDGKFLLDVPEGSTFIFSSIGFVKQELTITGATSSSGGYGYNIPEKEFVDGYEPGDKRKAATLFVPGDLYTDGPVDAQGRVQVQPASLQGSPNGYNIRKFYAGILSTIWDSPLNVPILRLADVYLIKAEAGGAGALAALNTVRSRAGLPAATTTSQATVLKERRYELAFEMDRWYDLKRTKTLLTNPSLVAKGIKPFNDLLPIPQVERDVNANLTQNPGY